MMDVVQQGIPARQECLRLMETYEMLPHIRAHSLAVCRFAMAIADAVSRRGCSLDLAAIEAAALLHDITKTRSLATGENHARTGAELLRKLGYTRIADMVQGHVTPPDLGGALTAEELISYADKRVLHDRIVSLDERFDYLYQRYGRDATTIERIGRARTRALQIEDKIRTLLNGSARAILCDVT